MLAALGLILALHAPVYETAQEAFSAGEAHYQQGEYEDAAPAFEQAYDLDPLPVYLFAWAQALRLAGDCRDAVPVYERFLATDRPPDEVAHAEEGVRACARQLAEEEQQERPPNSPPPIVAAEAPQTQPVDENAPSRQPWHRDPLGGVLLGVGAAALTTGIGLRVGAESVRRRADDSAMHSDYDTQIRRARGLAGAGIGVLAAGTALLVGAVVRYVIVARRGRRR